MTNAKTRSSVAVVNRDLSNATPLVASRGNPIPWNSISSPIHSLMVSIVILSLRSRLSLSLPFD